MSVGPPALKGEFITFVTVTARRIQTETVGVQGGARGGVGAGGHSQEGNDRDEMERKWSTRSRVTIPPATHFYILTPLVSKRALSYAPPFLVNRNKSNANKIKKRNNVIL